ncbi:STAS domain-containing protein [Streptomyces sp. NPDC058623]|uniref:STAS domain-containing protein n=1 Tax=Streptomyces sp. NPDC058623 TaxID=3346563 RepID=UPI00364DC044
MAEQGGSASGNVDDASGVGVIRVVGDLDQDTASVQGLDASLWRAVSHPDAPPEIVVDVSGLRFCDSTGLNVLLRARANAVLRGRTIRLAAPNTQLVRLLQRTGAIVLFSLGTAS